MAGGRQGNQPTPCLCVNYESSVGFLGLLGRNAANWELAQQKCIFSQFRRREVWAPGVSRVTPPPKALGKEVLWASLHAAGVPRLVTP